MKWIAAVILFLVVAFLVAVLVWNVGAGPRVVITVTNATPVSVKSVLITHDSGTVTLGAIPPGDKRVVRFDVHGESGCRLEVRLANGRIVKGGCGYVEPGYRVSETITPKGIKSKVEL